MKKTHRHCERSEAIQSNTHKTGLPRRPIGLLAMTILGISTLTACGFHPVYGVNKHQETGVEQYMAQVEIAGIPNYEGQYLRNALIDRFYRNDRPVNPVYTLHVGEIKEYLIDLDITKTSDATRGQLRLDTRATLVNNHTGQTILERDLRSITSYNILASEFSTRVSEDNARKNAIDDLARQIENQLSLYFKRQ